MPKAKAKSKRAMNSMMELETLAETVSNRRRQGKCPESLSLAVESVTGSGLSGAASGPGISSAEAVPGTITHAKSQLLGHVLS
ncbi:hypothetical protein DPMN_167304 [Dreissena polymorpha]|uniref:Uncharacterized protein n=1 Tax=Dreissena polymorpha TaxID=45954 RepID=A0A9D4F160_DREPO|nr:hypothetical protein DPMN_167304 [Dreissena polymorpha]